MNINFIYTKRQRAIKQPDNNDISNSNKQQYRDYAKGLHWINVPS